MKFYRLKGPEMDTLPYWEFENQYNPSQPGRSYAHEGVKMLVSRKCAMLAGLHASGDLTVYQLISRGKRLFNAE